MDFGGGLFSSRRDSRGRRRFTAHPSSTYYYTVARARVCRGPVTFLVLARDTRPWTEEPLKKIYTIIFSLNNILETACKGRFKDGT